MVIKGISWFGLETSDRAPHGLWARSARQILEPVRAQGFNSIRLPLSPESIHPGFATRTWAGDYGQTGREVLENILRLCGDLGFSVLLDFHRFEAANECLPGKPWGYYCCKPGQYLKQDWLEAVEEMARLSLQYDHVIGIDLCNEPHAMKWQAWIDAVALAGHRALAINPAIKLFVEGIGEQDDTGGFGCFWGENLVQGLTPPDIPPGSLVYSPHVYGPSVAMQDYFGNGTGYPNNLPNIWDLHFGYLTNNGYTVMPGEFGGNYDNTERPSDKQWQDRFVQYLLERNFTGFYYWCINPNSGDTGGLYEDDWQTLRTDKVALLTRLLNNY